MKTMASLSCVGCTGAVFTTVVEIWHFSIVCKPVSTLTIMAAGTRGAEGAAWPGLRCSLCPSIIPMIFMFVIVL